MKKTPMVRIRSAKREDTNALVALSLAMARETEGRRLDETRLHKGIRAVLSDPRLGSFIIAEAREGSRRRIVGQLMLTYEWSDWRNGIFLWVQSVYVDPAWRRQGVYRALYRHVLERARRDPATCGIRLYVARDNRTARTVYRRVGLSSTRYIVYERDFVLESPTDHRRT
jgi:ribosomal protein S18 acetylase RimI-like enzyme